MEKEYCKYCKKDLNGEDIKIIIQNHVTFWFCGCCENPIRSVNTKTRITTYY